MPACPRVKSLYMYFLSLSPAESEFGVGCFYCMQSFERTRLQAASSAQRNIFDPEKSVLLPSVSKEKYLVFDHCFFMRFSTGLRPCF